MNVFTDIIGIWFGGGEWQNTMIKKSFKRFCVSIDAVSGCSYDVFCVHGHRPSIFTTGTFTGKRFLSKKIKHFMVNLIFIIILQNKKRKMKFLLWLISEMIGPTLIKVIAIYIFKTRNVFHDFLIFYIGVVHTGISIWLTKIE